MASEEDDGFVNGAPRLLLRLEGAAALVAALIAYHFVGWSWWLFVILILAPDLAMLGYLVNPRVGAACYNAVHTYVPPILLGGWGLLAGEPLALSLALIWTAHIGADRVLGYGLKYDSAFTATHLGAIGKARGAPQAR